MKKILENICKKNELQMNLQIITHKIIFAAS